MSPGPRDSQLGFHPHCGSEAEEFYMGQGQLQHSWCPLGQARAGCSSSFLPPCTNLSRAVTCKRLCPAVGFLLLLCLGSEPAPPLAISDMGTHLTEHLLPKTISGTSPGVPAACPSLDKASTSG